MSRYQFDNLTGREFGRLKVMSFFGYDAHGNTQWACQCSCGNKKIVGGSHLRRKNTSSCGCLKKEAIKFKFTKHGQSKSKLMRVWNSMKQRCFNKNDKAYSNYGGRGIRVCALWLDSVAFIEWADKSGYREGLTIERINNDGDYEPSNCTWLPKALQTKNRRKFSEWNLANFKRNTDTGRFT